MIHLKKSSFYKNNIYYKYIQIYIINKYLINFLKKKAFFFFFFIQIFILFFIFLKSNNFLLIEVMNI